MRASKSFQVNGDLIFWAAGFVLLAISVLLVFLTYQVSQWPRVAALVTRSAVIMPFENNYRAEILVRYQFDGQEYERALDTHISGRMRSLVEGIVESYPEGEEVDLPINPADPSDVRMAVAWTWVDLMAPVLVALTGLIMLAVPWFMAWLDRRASPRLIGGALMVVGVVLIATGVLLAWTKVQILAWPETRATVVESSLRTMRSKKQRLRLVLEYEVDGRTYRSQVLSRLAAKSPAAMEAWRDSLPPGTSLTVRTMPSQPGLVNFEAAATAGYFFECWMFGLLGLLATGLGWAVRHFLK